MIVWRTPAADTSAFEVGNVQQENLIVFFAANRLPLPLKSLEQLDDSLEYSLL